MKILLSPHILPFAVFMSFIGAESGLTYLAAKGFLPGIEEEFFLFLYPVKAVLVGFLLLHFYRSKAYPEVDFKDLKQSGASVLSIAVGLLVFAGWIHLEAASLGVPRGYNPSIVGNGALRLVLIAFRLVGAALVVPVMEEIFWRSFLMRFIIDPDFKKVAIGRFSWSSLLLTALLFGLEHHLFLAGMLTGIVYALLLYRTRNLAQCILCHGITNLALGIFVLRTDQWQFW
jgi:hypothetical protein